MSEASIHAVASIVAAFISNNATRPDDLPQIMADVHERIVTFGRPETVAEESPAAPAMPKSEWRKSIRSDGLVSYEDQKVYQTLKRHLSRHGMTMDDYRRKWGLPQDYPSVSPDYSARRSKLAFARGLGRKKDEAAVETSPAEPESSTPKRGGPHPKATQTRKRAPQGERAAA